MTGTDAYSTHTSETVSEMKHWIYPTSSKFPHAPLLLMSIKCCGRLFGCGTPIPYIEMSASHTLCSEKCLQ